MPSDGRAPQPFGAGLSSSAGGDPPGEHHGPRPGLASPAGTGVPAAGDAGRRTVLVVSGADAPADQAEDGGRRPRLVQGAWRTARRAAAPLGVQPLAGWRIPGPPAACARGWPASGAPVPSGDEPGLVRLAAPQRVDRQKIQRGRRL